MTIFLICIKIFLARLVDVSLGTLRTIVTVKGKNALASSIGFVEVLIWFLIVREALAVETSSIWIAISYALGFALGTFLGGKISQKIVKGNLTVQIIMGEKYTILANKLREEGYAVSILNVKGKEETEEKYMLFIEIENKSLYHLQQIVNKTDPTAFIVINESKYVLNGFIKPGGRKAK